MATLVRVEGEWEVPEGCLGRNCPGYIQNSHLGNYIVGDGMVIFFPSESSWEDFRRLHEDDPMFEVVFFQKNTKVLPEDFSYPDAIGIRTHFRHMGYKMPG